MSFHVIGIINGIAWESSLKYYNIASGISGLLYIMKNMYNDDIIIAGDAFLMVINKILHTASNIIRDLYVIDDCRLSPCCF